MRADLTPALVAAIYNAAWSVRYWRRPAQHEQKAQAVARLGFVVRDAFNASEDFGPLLEAIRDALSERDARSS